MSNSTERRQLQRVEFEHAIECCMMAIDGTWRRDCLMQDVSETGCRLSIEGSIEGLVLKEFFLLLSSTGLAYRRCELSWVNGDQLGASFVKAGAKTAKSSAKK
jgi:PilZ domain